MRTLKRIREGGHFDKLKLVGNDLDKTMGLIVDLKDPNDVLYIGSLEIKNTFVPITLRSGRLIIDSVFNLNYGGDLIDVYATAPASLHINYLFSRKNKPTRHYSKYHQDILQLDYLKRYKSYASGVIRDIFIGNMDVVVSGGKAQGIVMTGACDYTNILLGTRRMHVRLDGYPHLVNAYQLRNSVIGGLDNRVNGDIFIKPRNRNVHKTENIILANVPVNQYGIQGLQGFDTGDLNAGEFREVLAVHGIHETYSNVA